ncbi:MAG: hypothetical protein HQL50_09815 [Magnetococcales bacterium]|nr:hypothetical protein [Magnetococcales bacterium]
MNKRKLQTVLEQWGRWCRNRTPVGPFRRQASSPGLVGWWLMSVGYS